MVLGIDCYTKSQDKETDARLLKGHLAKIHPFRWVLAKINSKSTNFNTTCSIYFVSVTTTQFLKYKPKSLIQRL